ncbi:hypothetical protein TKK_0002350 [Trichogramma kaykai]|uniref:MADF domain-containing protein n=1 Tax=Trichogramma kaykai TaxID=54128 RepID=A0ABD2XCL3_9HYME
MDPIQRIIIKNLIQGDNFNYIFDSKSVQHKVPEKINNFFCIVKNEVQERLNNDKIADWLKKEWYSMRKKFVAINKKKRNREPIHLSSEIFYKDLIFLEDYISHNDGRVYKTPNKEEISEASYNKIMGFTFDDADESESVEALLAPPKESKEVLVEEDESINLSDTEALEVLEDYREVVLSNLIVNSAPKCVQATATMPKPLDVPIIQSHEEQQIAHLRMRTEKLNLNSNEAIINETINVLMSALNETKNEVIRNLKFDNLVQSIKTFCDKFV